MIIDSTVGSRVVVVYSNSIEVTARESEDPEMGPDVRVRKLCRLERRGPLILQPLVRRVVHWGWWKSVQRCAAGVLLLFCLLLTLGLALQTNGVSAATIEAHQHRWARSSVYTVLFINLGILLLAYSYSLAGSRKYRGAMSQILNAYYGVSDAKVAHHSVYANDARLLFMISALVLSTLIWSSSGSVELALVSYLGLWELTLRFERRYGYHCCWGLRKLNLSLQWLTTKAPGDYELGVAYKAVMHLHSKTVPRNSVWYK